MKKKKMHRPLWAVLLLGVLFAAPCLYGDGHIITESVLSFAGRTRTEGAIEVWIGDNKSCLIKKNGTIILRPDLKKKWTLHPKQKKYLEESLENPFTIPATATSAKKKKVRMQDVGWRYDPVYDWTIKESKGSHEIDGKKCRFITALGDADYSETKCELWVTRDVPFDINFYNSCCLQYIPGAVPDALYRLLPELEKSFVLKIKNTTEGAITTTRIKTFKVMKLEAAESPPGVYEIPPGFQRIDSKKESRRK